MKIAKNSLTMLLSLALLLSACSKMSPNAPPNGNSIASNTADRSKKSGPEPVTQARCFFEGNVSAAIRTKTEATKDGLALSLEWDATAPAGGGWMPPAKISQVEMPFGAPCMDPKQPFSPTGIQARVTGDRSLQILLGNAFLEPMPQHCPARRFKMTITLSPTSYEANCKQMEGEGLPFHNLLLDISVPASGPPTIHSVEGGSYLEG